MSTSRAMSHVVVLRNRPEKLRSGTARPARNGPRSCGDPVERDIALRRKRHSRTATDEFEICAAQSHSDGLSQPSVQTRLSTQSICFAGGCRFASMVRWRMVDWKRSSSSRSVSFIGVRGRLVRSDCRLPDEAREGSAGDQKGRALNGDVADRLGDQAETSRHHARLDLLENEIEKRIDDTSAMVALNRGIERLRTAMTIKDVSEELGLSPHVFRKLFLRNIGLTPSAITGSRGFGSRLTDCHRPRHCRTWHSMRSSRTSRT
jgi:AraC-like DNA-binding protein